MTVGGDFVPAGPNDYEVAPTYPTIFGLTLTPTVSGVLIALLGLAGATYLLLNLVRPAWEQNQVLRQDVATKQSQLVDQAETQRRIQEAQEQLRQSRQLQADVLALFADKQSLDTLLIDLNERVQAQGATRGGRATLVRFESTTPNPEVVTDSSLGQAANNLLARQVYNIAMAGNYAQTQSIIRNIERLQPLLVVRGFTSELNTESSVIVLDPRGRVVPTAQPEPRITTSFQLIAILPASEVNPTAPSADAATAAPEAEASPAPTDGAVSPTPTDGAASPAPADGTASPTPTDGAASPSPSPAN
ncbi:pilus assembly protein PilO [Oculatella sp. LEGE 06141]|uniref:pilus assembly protein PilO n=1 Tax=Oculatella sp. LEGE 06141 TaxID=1828648 RepID=UPI001881C8A9|nr:pilus assembly protein PilO [Oculatella sp. LEGE 06141]MBE9179912.1 pilus assembly protein PilO [Oculatella sp. LEGE 06141]